MIDPQAGKQFRSKAQKRINLELRDVRSTKAYKYWGERLSIIYQAFDEAEPKTLYHWWIDERRGVQRWMFWVGFGGLFFVVIFGFLQTVIGVIQVILLYRPPH
jgi:hypothetical protein